jgi:hypothetical protein
MGHIHLGYLPTTVAWRRVTGLLAAGDHDPEQVAVATANAARDRITQLQSDRNLGYCVWLLVRLASAARSEDFETSVAQLGLELREADSVIGFLGAVSTRIREELDRRVGSGPFGELASDALRSTLAATIGAQCGSLFGGSTADIEVTFRRFGTPTQLGRILSDFFGAFFARVLRFYVDKALPLEIGPTGGFRSVHQSELFIEDLTRYARTTASVTEQFAREWFSKHHWQSEGVISREEAQFFVAHALSKLQTALEREGAAA